MKLGVARSLLHLMLSGALGVAACNGCRPSRNAETERPTVRLYLVSNVAGALEPCGCVKDQLGGLDHVAALIAQGKKVAPDSALVEAGPLYFLDPVIKEERKPQELVKAQAIADILKGLDFAGEAPGRNDWALGESTLGDLASRSAGESLACNARPTGKLLHASLVRVIDGVKIGFIGVAQPDKSDIGAPLGDLTFESPADAVKAEVKTLEAQGAQVLIAVAAVGRGEAKRIADASPELTAVLVGATAQGGEENTDAPPPELIGDVLVAETSNHLQTVGTLDLFVRGGSYKFRDGTGIALGQKRKELERRIDELHGKIADWERDPTIAPKDVTARKNDLVKLEADKKALDENPRRGRAASFGIASRKCARQSRDRRRRQAGLPRLLQEGGRSEPRHVRGPPGPACSGGRRVVRRHRHVRRLSPRSEGSLEPHGARPRVRDPRQGVQGVQPRLRELSRHRLRAAGRQQRDARREAEGRAMRGLPRSLVPAHRRSEAHVKPPPAQARRRQVRELPPPAPRPLVPDAAAKMPEILGPGHGMK